MAFEVISSIGIQLAFWLKRGAGLGFFCVALTLPRANADGGQGILELDPQTGAASLRIPLGPGIGHAGVRYVPALVGRFAPRVGLAGLLHSRTPEALAPLGTAGFELSPGTLDLWLVPGKDTGSTPQARWIYPDGTGGQTRGGPAAEAAAQSFWTAFGYAVGKAQAVPQLASPKGFPRDRVFFGRGGEVLLALPEVEETLDLESEGTPTPGGLPSRILVVRGEVGYEYQAMKGWESHPRAAGSAPYRLTAIRATTGEAVIGQDYSPNLPGPMDNQGDNHTLEQPDLATLLNNPEAERALHDSDFIVLTTGAPMIQTSYVQSGIQPRLSTNGPRRTAPMRPELGQNDPLSNPVTPGVNPEDRGNPVTRLSMFPYDPDPLATMAALDGGATPVGPGSVPGDPFRGVASWLADQWRENVADPIERLRNFQRGIGWVEDRYVPGELMRLATTDRSRAERLARKFLWDMEMARLPLMGCGGLRAVAAPTTSFTFRIPSLPSAPAVSTNGTVALSSANTATIPLPSGAMMMTGPGRGQGADFKQPASGKSAKEAAKDVPSWAKGERPLISENGKKFADRLMKNKYGENWKENGTGPDSEFNKIKKWGDRGFEQR